MISLLNWNPGYKPPAANQMGYPGIRVCEIPISSIRSSELKARVKGPKELRKENRKLEDTWPGPFVPQAKQESTQSSRFAFHYGTAEWRFAWRFEAFLLEDRALPDSTNRL